MNTFSRGGRNPEDFLGFNKRRKEDFLSFFFWRCKVSDDGDWLICGRFDFFWMLVFWTLPQE